MKVTEKVNLNVSEDLKEANMDGEDTAPVCLKTQSCDLIGCNYGVDRYFTG